MGPPIARENVVHRVTHDGRSYALRLHRAGLRTAAELRSELAWMAGLAAAGVSVPAPIATGDGDFLVEDEAGRASLLTWSPGAPMGAAGRPLDPAHGPEVFFRLGAEMAALHNASNAWDPPAEFTRPSWLSAGLIGPVPLWGRFWDAPFLDPPARARMVDLRIAASRDLPGLKDPDIGLIHADLLRENVLVDGQSLHFIDFDDCGWGHRAFDIATTLLKYRREPAYKDLCAALIAGYHSRRALDLAALPLFLALRAASYLGWMAARLDEPGMAERIDRNVGDALWAAEAYLTT